LLKNQKGIELNKKRTFSVAFAIVIVLCGFAGLGTYAYRHAGMWLVVSDPLPDSLDVIFTFAGENERIAYSKQMFSRYPKSIWVLSYPGKKIILPLAREGFDTSRIYIVDTCRNTASEVAFFYSLTGNESEKASGRETRLKFVRGIFAEGRKIRLGLISTPYHMRRIRMLATRKKDADRFSFSFLPVPYEYYGWTNHVYTTWWKNNTLRPAIYLELKKFAYYFIKP
jgi:uncharacterized SAM-binding protein YcdF (DUF218 family)